MSAPLKFGLTSDALMRIRSVFAQYPKIEKVILYGSRAKGNFRPGSDIDLTLFGLELTTTDLLKIEGDLDELLLPQKFDLSLHHQIENQDLLAHIERVGVPL